MSYTSYRSRIRIGFFWGIFFGGIALIFTLDSQSISQQTWFPLVTFVVVFLLCRVFWSMHIDEQNLKIRSGLLWRTVPLESVKHLNHKLKYAGKGAYHNYLKIVYEHETGQLRGFMINIESIYYDKKTAKKFFNDIFNRLPKLPISSPLSRYLKSNLELQPTNPIVRAVPAVEEFDAVLEHLGFRPRFSEGQLFLMSFFFVIMLVSNRELWTELVALNKHLFFYTGALAVWAFIIEAMFFFGVILSLYHFFVKTKKSKYTKRYLYTFGSFMLITVGILSGAYLLGADAHDSDVVNLLYLIFPAQNILYGLILLFTFSSKHARRLVDDDDGDLNEILVSLPVLIVFIIVGIWIMDIHWSMIFSAVMFYIAFINTYVQNVFELLGFKPHHVHLNLPNLEATTHYYSKNILEEDGKYTKIVWRILVVLFIFFWILGEIMSASL